MVFDPVIYRDSYGSVMAVFQKFYQGQYVRFYCREDVVLGFYLFYVQIATMIEINGSIINFLRILR